MRYVILIVIGLVLALGVTMLLKPSNKPVDDSEWVLTATQNLQPGNFIIAVNHLKFVDMKGGDIKEGYIQKKNVNVSELEGAVVRSLIKAGEPIIKEKIVTPKEGGFLSAVLYPGKRAISVGVNVVSANAGFIFPGDRVDLLLTHEVANLNNEKSFATETFLEDVRVLAIDQQVSNPENKALIPKTVTLEVTPKQAEEILVATELGKISLSLRSSGAGIVDTEDHVGRSMTRDNEVSRIINESRPLNRENYEVTVTRGKNTVEMSVNAPKQETAPAQPEQPLPEVTPNSSESPL